MSNNHLIHPTLCWETVTRADRENFGMLAVEQELLCSACDYSIQHHNGLFCRHKKRRGAVQKRMLQNKLCPDSTVHHSLIGNLCMAEVCRDCKVKRDNREQL